MQMPADGKCAPLHEAAVSLRTFDQQAVHGYRRCAVREFLSMKYSRPLRPVVAACALLFTPVIDAEDAPAFLRAIETDAKLRAIQTGTVEYRPAGGAGPNVLLVSVSHLGTPEYYAALQKRLDAQTVVLFEGVGFDERMKSGPRAKADDDGIQKQLSDALGLTFQLDAIDYRRKHFINSDLPVAGVQKKVREKTAANGTEGANETFDTLMQAISGSAQTAEMLKPVMAFLNSSPEMRETTRLLLIEVLSRADEMVAFAKSVSPEMNDLFDVLLTERNAIVIRDVKKQIARLKPGQTVAVFYGAAHMTGLAKQLDEELHYAPAGTQWDTAFTADPAKSPIPAPQLRMILDMVRAQLQQTPPEKP